MPATKETGGLKRWAMNRAADGQNAEIRIYSDIGFWYGSQMFLEQLDSLGQVDVIDVRINSYGGIASEGIAIYNALAMHPAKKRVWIDAAAYSIASVIAMAASPGELRIADNARLMQHNAWNMAEGDKRELRKVADILDKLDGTLATTYAKRMKNHSRDEILALMGDETWYTPQEAVDAGLADEIFDAADVGATEESFNLIREFKRPPADVVERAKFSRNGKPAPPSLPGPSLAAAVRMTEMWNANREREAANPLPRASN